MAGNRRFKKLGILVVIFLMSVNPPDAHADIIRGLMKIVGGVIEVPKSLIVGTLTGPPIIGTIAGTLIGAVNGVVMAAGGAIETAFSVVPLALKALPFLI